MFAKSHAGKFVLRIEDTDSARNVPGSMQAIENDLKWLSIIPDESPSCGGPFGPYSQSERLHIYQAHAEYLLEKESAYRCFCSAERLERLKKTFKSYDNKCRNLTSSEVKMLKEEKLPYCIRLKVLYLYFLY